MSRQDEPLTPAAIWFAAGQSIAGHTGERRCPQCTDEGCPQLAWALDQRAGGKAVSVVPILLLAARP
ncbi:hypothetical protein [Micromonospora sp. NBC_01796]|uniref:hypothetical protein n=1 Tax=Micromonospora sp. NBC_01796 TaxID=2975987 RepID=UPI002DD924FB|nr:hypothetical protein [Micromonospora sp. NBC_01796]WSA87071.1 hypothetical protein OIE47_05470 [Micromonospora sp. NBC_01796]